MPLSQNVYGVLSREFMKNQKKEEYKWRKKKKTFRKYQRSENSQTASRIKI